MKNLLLVSLVIFAFSQNLYSQILNVPDDFPTIQAAIDASGDGDTVLVQPGETRVAGRPLARSQQ